MASLVYFVLVTTFSESGFVLSSSFRSSITNCWRFLDFYLMENCDVDLFQPSHGKNSKPAFGYLDPFLSLQSPNTCLSILDNGIRHSVFSVVEIIPFVVCCLERRRAIHTFNQLKKLNQKSKVLKVNWMSFHSFTSKISINSLNTHLIAILEPSIPSTY